MAAQYIKLVKRGEISRPGDFADKIFFINKKETIEKRKQK